jgi:EPS-associated MarR family transcriptional regulator
LGRVNYCLQALISKGWIKATNFKNSHHKAAYMYLLTPRGLEEKGRLTLRFLVIKMREYEKLRVEIEEIRREAERRGRRNAARASRAQHCSFCAAVLSIETDARDRWVHCRAVACRKPMITRSIV